MDANALNRKITWRILPYLFLLYVLSFLDRANLGNAHTSMARDVHFTEEEYSIGVSVFFIGYIIFEIPSNILLKMTGAPVWFAIIMVVWGGISCCMMFVHDFTSLILVRVFLGIAEAGFVPGAAYYLSCWFPPNEMGFRFALFFSSVSVAGAIAGLAAYGLLQMDGMGGLKGWQWLFLLEGIPTVIAGIFCIWALPASPSTAAFLSPEEREFAKSRINTALNDHSDHSHINKEQLIGVLKDVRVWLAATLYSTQILIVYCLSFFLPALIQQFGFTDLISNLLTVPIHACAAVAVVLNGLHSDRTSERYLHSVIPNAFALIFWGVEAYSLESDNLALQYSMVVLGGLCSSMACPITVVWPGDFTKGATTAAIIPAIIIGVGNLGGIVGPNLFGISFEFAGNYTWGVTAMAISSFFSIVFATGLHLVLKREEYNLREEEYLLKQKHSK